jgi:hypothetical protein
MGSLTSRELPGMRITSTTGLSSLRSFSIMATGQQVKKVMKTPPSHHTAFVEALLLERDDFYRETVRLKDQLSEYRDVEHMKASYEQTICDRDLEISSLKQQAASLLRKIWGKSGERFVKEDPLQRRIDFEGGGIARRAGLGSAGYGGSRGVQGSAYYKES